MSADILAGDVDSYFQEHFADVVLSGEWVRNKEFEDCRFERCRFSDCTLFECTFLECTFEDCLLSGVKVPGCSFIDARFVECKLVGPDWTVTPNFRGIELNRCALDFANFSGMKLKGLKLLDCICKEADFQEADLTEGDFRGTDFAESIFQHTNLTRANFASAHSYAIDPRNNTLRGARFSLPEAMSLLAAFEIKLVNPE